MKDKISVIKSNGEKEPFSFKKVLESTKRVGANEELARHIAVEIQKRAYPGVKTSEIFREILKLLSKESLNTAIRFNLKEAIRKLGPTGFPFEKFVGAIFREEGFRVELNQSVPGFCTKYEIDFLAEKAGSIYVGECKYHHLPGEKVDLSVALANYARFLDIEKGRFFDHRINYKSVLVTNTKFSSQVIKYSRCVGVELLGWKYPRRSGLEKLIEENKLYPVTILPQVNLYLANVLIPEGIVLVRDIFKIDFENFAKTRHIKKKRAERILNEAKILLNK